jgi:arylsulfatase
MIKFPTRMIRAALAPLFTSCALLTLPVTTGYAQQATGVPGSPSATTTIPGTQLPPPPQKFEGKIERNAAQSKPYWPARVVPPKARRTSC